MEDIQSSARLFSELLGAGPFLHYSILELENVRYLQEPADIELEIALGACNDMVVELIRQTAGPDSLFVPGRSGSTPEINHWSVFTDKFDEDRERQIGLGRSEVFSAEVRDPDSDNIARLAYFDTRKELGAYFELMEAYPSPLKKSYEAILSAPQNSDRNELFVQG